jgi:hypothetical protein
VGVNVDSLGEVLKKVLPDGFWLLLAPAAANAGGGYRQPMAAHVPVEPKSLDFERRTIALAPISRLCVEPHGSSSHACTDRNGTGNGRTADRTTGDTASDTRQSNGAAG